MQKARWRDQANEGRARWDGPPPGTSAFEQENSLGAIAWQSKGTILLGSIVAAVVTYAALLQVTPVYEAKTQVILESASSPVINIPNVVPETIQNVGYTASALIMLESTDLLRTVVEDLKLNELKEYNPALREPDLSDRIKALIEPYLPADDGQSENADTTKYMPQNADDPLSGTLRSLRSAVSVKALGESQVVEVAAQSSNPRLAALISDTISEQFISQQLEAKILAGGQATEWLEERAAELRVDLADSEKRVAEFRSRIVNSGQFMSTDLELRVEDVNTQVAELTLQQSNLIASRDEITNLLSDENYVALTEVLNLPAVTDLYQRLAELESRVIELHTQFGEHLGVANAREARDLVKSQLTGHIEQALSGLNVRIDLAAQRLNVLSEQLQSLRRDLADHRQAELKLVELEREAEASRDVYNRFLLRMKEARERSLFQTSEASIVSYAEVPIAPASPQKTKIAAIAGVAGGLIALALIVLSGRHHTRIKDPRDVAALTGLAAVYQLPNIPGIRNPAQLLPKLRKSSDPALSGGVNWLRLRLTPKKADRPTVIVVTSAGDDEGKSALSVMLAEAFDINGYSTALVNSDPNGGGLSMLQEAREFRGSSVRFFDFSEGAFRILELEAGFDLSMQERMRSLNRSDVIIIDGPAALTSPEIIELSALADHVVLACLWSQTTAQRLKQCVDLLYETGVQISGVVINKVPKRLIRISKPPSAAKREVPRLMPPSA